MSRFSDKWYLLLPFFRCLSIRAAEGTRTSGEMAVNAQKEPRFLCVDFFIKQAFMNPHIYANFIQFWPSERFCFSRGINPLSVISLDVLTVLMHTNLNVVLSLSTVPYKLINDKFPPWQHWIVASAQAAGKPFSIQSPFPHQLDSLWSCRFTCCP